MVDRVFKAIDRHGAEMEFELVESDMGRENEAEMRYRIAYSAGLKLGVLPRDKMREMLSSQDIWSDDEEVALREVVKDVALLEIKLQEASTRGQDDECISIARQLSKARLDMFRLFMIQQGVYVNSCEGYAEVIRQEALMASCVVFKATGKRYWKDYTEYVLERDSNTKATVAEVAMELNGVLLEEERREITDHYPEQEYLKDSAVKMSNRLAEELVKAKESLKEKVDKAHEVEVENNDSEGSSGEAVETGMEEDGQPTAGLGEHDSS